MVIKLYNHVKKHTKKPLKSEGIIAANWGHNIREL